MDWLLRHKICGRYFLFIAKCTDKKHKLFLTFGIFEGMLKLIGHHAWNNLINFSLYHEYNKETTENSVQRDNLAIGQGSIKISLNDRTMPSW